MSERSLRRRIPVGNRRARPPHPSPSPHRGTPPTPRRSSKPSRPIKILQRSKSEPTLSLWTVGLGGSADGHRNLTPPDAVIFRPQTCIDIFSSPDFLRQSPKKFEGYNEDSKVVVNVTVEGSPGPIRTMVRLGSSVEDTIRVVINKYGEEGRSPKIDKKAASTFELHHSYFSLQCLDKTEVIGDVGSRSFYLRKSSGGSTSSITERASSPAPPSTRIVFLPGFIARKFNKIIRRTRKLWKILGCMHCNG
uniref:DUF7054 domain-containing protein n=1 Tax=Davidia involucrata TaxID=16924 RepID=A0A5B7BEV0_DAVIN